MSKNRIVICILGGNMQDAYADDPKTEIILFDWDNIKAESTDKEKDALEQKYEETIAKMNHVY